MARYRIVKVPTLSGGSGFHIEKLVENSTYGIGIRIESKEWIMVDRYGRMTATPETDLYYDYDEAKKFLDLIIEMSKRESEIVFDTLTDNPPKETGT